MSCLVQISKDEKEGKQNLSKYLNCFMIEEGVN